MHKTIVVGLSVLIAFTALCAIGLYWALSPVQTGATEMITFTVPKGQSVSGIASRLTEAGLVRHPLIFRLVVWKLGLEKKMQAGSFKLSQSMRPSDIAASLTEGTEDLWITVLEGWRREEIAEYLAKQELSMFSESEFLTATEQLEGTLFPDTYLVPREMSISALISLFTNTFETKVTMGLADDMAAFARSGGHTIEDIIIMASLVQREARSYDQMRHVAGILWNRINIGMPLQVDATLQYARGFDGAQNSWWPTPLASDRQRNSPYNTYMHAGLPPGAISNPGLDAVRATLNPLSVDDLFYLHSPDGAMYYAKTLDEHNTNIQNYLR